MTSPLAETSSGLIVPGDTSDANRMAATYKNSGIRNFSLYGYPVCKHFNLTRENLTTQSMSTSTSKSPRPTETREFDSCIKFGPYVTVYKPDSDEGEENRSRINWACIGSVPLERAEEFLQDLTWAVKRAKTLDAEIPSSPSKKRTRERDYKDETSKKPKIQDVDDQEHRRRMAGSEAKQRRDEAKRKKLQVGNTRGYLLLSLTIPAGRRREAWWRCASVE